MGALVGALEASSPAAAATAAATAAAAVIDRANRGGGGGGSGGGSEALATFELLGGIPLIMERLARQTGEARESRVACAKAARSIAAGGAVARRCLAACGAPKALAATLSSPGFYSGEGNRELTRACVETCAEMMRAHEDEERGRGGGGEGVDFSGRRKKPDDAAAAAAATTTTTDDDAIEDVPAGRAAGWGMRVAIARAGLLPPLVRALSSLHAASNEEAGVGPGGGGGFGGLEKNSAAAASKTKTKSSPLAGRNANPDLPPHVAATVSGTCRDLVADILLSATSPGHGARDAIEALCETSTLHGLLALVGAPLPASTSKKILALVRRLARERNAHEPMQRAGAIPKLARFLQWEDDDHRETAMVALFHLCGGGGGGGGGGEDAGAASSAAEDPGVAARREQAAIAGAVPHLVAVATPEIAHGDATVDVSSSAASAGRGVVNGLHGDGDHWRRHPLSAAKLRALASSMLCAFAYSSRKTRLELSKHRALDAYLSLVASGEGGAGSATALRAVSAWQRDEPWAAEARLMEPDAVASIAAALQPRPGDVLLPCDAFLTTLLGLLKRSPRVCAGVAQGGGMAPLVEALGPPSSSAAAASGLSRSSSGGAFRGGLLDTHPGRALLFLRLLAVVYEHHPRREEAAAGYDVRARLRGVLERGGGGGREAAAAVDVAEELLRKMR